MDKTDEAQLKREVIATAQTRKLFRSQWNERVRLILSTPPANPENPNEPVSWDLVRPADLEEPVTEQALATWLRQRPRYDAMVALEAHFDPELPLAVPRSALLSLVSELCREHLWRFFQAASPGPSPDAYALYADHLVESNLSAKRGWQGYPWHRDFQTEDARRAERRSGARYLKEAMDSAEIMEIHTIGGKLVAKLEEVEPRMRRAYADALVACAARAKRIADFDLQYARIAYELLEPADVEAFVRALVRRPKLLLNALADVEEEGGATGAAALVRLANDPSLPEEAVQQLSRFQKKVDELAAVPDEFRVRSFEEVVATFETLGFDASPKRKPKLRRGRSFDNEAFEFVSYSPSAGKEPKWQAAAGGRVVAFPCLYLGESGPWNSENASGFGSLLDRVASFEAVVMKGRGTMAKVSGVAQPEDYVVANLDVSPPERSDDEPAEEVAVAAAWRVSEGWAYVIMTHDHDTPWRLRRLLDVNFPTTSPQTEADQVLGDW